MFFIVSRERFSSFGAQALVPGQFFFIEFYSFEEAKRIIEAPDGWGKKNSYIANEAGFKNLNVFYHAFKKFTGKSDGVR